VVGGRARNEVAFSAYLFYKHGGGGGLGADKREDEYGECLDPATIVEQCRRFIQQYGFREIKLKGGVLDPDVEIATIKALREAFGPSYPLRIDPNCAWSIPTSVRVGRELKDELSNGGYLEDPCATLEGMAEVRRRLREEGIDMPMASNVAVTCFEQVAEAQRLDAVQVVLSDPHYWGGVRSLQQLAHLCETLKMGVSMHSTIIWASA
jgi:L-alanine-DL-glutamate epimerase and related enzymes of enolase superfamily